MRKNVIIINFFILYFIHCANFIFLDDLKVFHFYVEFYFYMVQLLPFGITTQRYIIMGKKSTQI